MTEPNYSKLESLLGSYDISVNGRSIGVRTQYIPDPLLNEITDMGFKIVAINPVEDTTYCHMIEVK
jgi:hypothetical protein